MKLKLLEEIIKAFMDMMSLTNSEEKLTSSSIVIVIVPKFSMKYGIVITHTYIHNAWTHKYTDTYMHTLTYTLCIHIHTYTLTFTLYRHAPIYVYSHMHAYIQRHKTHTDSTYKHTH